MKWLPIVLVVVAAITCGGPASAQIPNPGFETWAGANPAGWSTNNEVGLVPVTQSTDRHSGSFAAKGEVVSFFGFAIGPYLLSGSDSATGFPVSQRHASLTGWYKFAPLGAGTDRMVVTVVMISGDSAIGAGSSILESASSFTSFALPIFYIPAVTPDTALITITIISTDSLNPFPTIGSSFIVDDLAFAGIVSVEEGTSSVPADFTLEQNYPNPFNGETRIGYRVRGSGTGEWVSLVVYDMLGREVATLVNEVKAPGEYSVGFNASSLSSGVYVYRLQTGSAVATRRMVLLR